MKIYLGVVHTQDLGSSEPPRHHHKVDLRSELTQAEISEYEEAERTLLTVRANAELFHILVWNLEEFIRGIASHLRAYATRNMDTGPPRLPHLDINRLALNCLSSMRTYLDHLETSIAKRHGAESANLKNFRQYCAEAYDSQFSYRFLYRLRNYAQHCGLPIGQITFSTRPSEQDASVPLHSLQIAVLRDRVLSEFDWGSLKEEVVAQQPTIDISYHMTETMGALELINSRVMEDELPSLVESAERIHDLVGTIQFDEGEPCIFRFEKDIVSEDEPKKLNTENLAFSRIPIDLALAVIRTGYDGILPSEESTRRDE